jgi:hypothetical protein
MGVAQGEKAGKRVREMSPTASSPVASKRPRVAKEQEALLDTEKHAQEVLAQAKVVADQVYRPMIDQLTVQVFNLTKALEDHRKASKAQIKDIIEAFTKQNDTLKAEILALISTQLAGTRVPTTRSFAGAVCAGPPDRTNGPPLPETAIERPREGLFCTVDTTNVEESAVAKTSPGAIRTAIELGVRAKETQR